MNERVEMCEKSVMQERQSGEGTGLYLRKFARELLCENAMFACSACAGDYEDPDRTAWMPDEEAASDADDADDADALLEEEFPAEK